MVTVAIVVFGPGRRCARSSVALDPGADRDRDRHLPGTAPSLVADEVAKPLEQAISGVSGVTKVRSESTNGWPA